MEQEIQQLKKEIDALKKRFESLQSTTTIPYNVAVAMKSRLKQDFVAGDTSSESPATHTQAVNESGIASYSVAKPMSGFIQITFNGINYDIPYY